MYFFYFGTSALARADRTGDVQIAIQQFQITYPTNSFSNTSAAEQAISRAEELQTLIQVYVADAEAACYDKFLVNACLEDVRLQRRQWQNQVRRISLDAKSYLRQERSRKTQKSDNGESITDLK